MKVLIEEREFWGLVYDAAWRNYQIDVGGRRLIGDLEVIDATAQPTTADHTVAEPCDLPDCPLCANVVPMAFYDAFGVDREIQRSGDLLGSDLLVDEYGDHVVYCDCD